MLRLTFNPTGADLDAAIACEQDVFLDAFGNTAEQLTEEYGPYEAQSTHMAIIDDESGRALAHMRLISDGPAGIKTLNDVSREPWNVDGLRAVRAAGFDPAHTWDIGTISVRPEARKGALRLSAALFHGLNRAMAENSKTHLVAIFDEPARRSMTLMGLHVQRLPGCAVGEYLGSAASTPIWGARADILDQQRRESPDAYRLVTLGVGLDGVQTPELSAYLLAA